MFLLLTASLYSLHLAMRASKKQSNTDICTLWEHIMRQTITCTPNIDHAATTSFIESYNFVFLRELHAATKIYNFNQ